EVAEVRGDWQETESIRQFAGSRTSVLWANLKRGRKEDCEIPMKTLEDNQTLEDLLARHPFWNNLPAQYFPLLIECAVIERFRPGEQIFKRGYDAEHFYLIHHGKIALETAYVPGEGFITI